MKKRYQGYHIEGIESGSPDVQSPRADSARRLVSPQGPDVSEPMGCSFSRVTPPDEKPAEGDASDASSYHGERDSERCRVTHVPPLVLFNHQTLVAQ